jgi:predicted nucleic acid-binding protein
MSYLADSNILSRLAQPQNPHHAIARRAVITLRQQGEEICLVPQNLIEFWAVATRPMTSNGLGLTIDETAYEIKKFKRLFTVYDDIPNIFAEWENLVLKHNVSGKNVHDTRLVAAMLTHNITHLLTFNIKDFKRFTEIIAVDPQSVK